MTENDWIKWGLNIIRSVYRVANMKDIYIYGAKSIALGTCQAIRLLYPEHPVKGFIVTSGQGNPSILAGLPVRELGEFQRKDIRILIAVPENIHEEIVQQLQQRGYEDYICIDSLKEAKLMERYYEKAGYFPSIHSLKKGRTLADLQVYTVKFHRDVPLKESFAFPQWSIPIQVGAALTEKQISHCTDNTGIGISHKNGNYCELTALYWIWKNQLEKPLPEGSGEMNRYYGLFHYRRFLDITADDLYRLRENDVDVVLPYPMLHEPDITEHHTRYVQEKDWITMQEVLREMYPAYSHAFEGVFSRPYMYNYNMLIAKREVLADYCRWIFTILAEVEERSIPKGNMRADRYLAYMGESLLTLYFMYHQSDLNIFHAGRRMLI